jgi:hypothetical protein
MMKLVNEYFLFLSFDLEKLSTEGERYLEEICIKGRTTLFEHYTKNDGKTTEQARTLVESRKNTGDRSKSILLTDLLEISGSFISEKSTGDKSTGFVTHDFTRLFEYLMKEKPQLTRRLRKSVPSLINDLKELVKN